MIAHLFLYFRIYLCLTGLALDPGTNRDKKLVRPAPSRLPSESVPSRMRQMIMKHCSSSWLGVQSNKMIQYDKGKTRDWSGYVEDSAINHWYVPTKFKTKRYD